MPQKQELDKVSKLISAETWDKIVVDQINNASKRYTGNPTVQKVLANWQYQITSGYKRNMQFSPHINGFYMIFMVHGTWYDHLQKGVGSDWEVQSSEYLGLKDYFGKNGKGVSEPLTKGIPLSNPHSYLNMMATDIDIPDITEEYVSVSSRIRNSFIPSRDYFVSDFSISYIENQDLDIMRYHESWHKYMNLLRRGEIPERVYDCEDREESYFIDMPYTNAVWVAIFKPFTTDIQALIKLVGVMPVTMPLKQIVGNRSSTKMTVLNLSYKSADIFYKFYKNTNDLLNDDGLLATSFRSEILKF